MIMFYSTRINLFLSGIVSIFICFATNNAHALNRITLVKKLAIDGINGQRFSNASVALDDNKNLFISSYSGSLHTLYVYEYQHTLENDEQWRETAALNIPQIPEADGQHHTLVVNENFIVVGVPGEIANSENKTSRGALYIYDRHKHGVKKSSQYKSG